MKSFNDVVRVWMELFSILGYCIRYIKHYLVSHSFKKKKIPTYLPTSKMMGRSTANIQFFKDGLISGEGREIMKGFVRENLVYNS